MLCFYFLSNNHIPRLFIVHMLRGQGEGNEGKWMEKVNITFRMVRNKRKRPILRWSNWIYIFSSFLFLDWHLKQHSIHFFSYVYFCTSRWGIFSNSTASFNHCTDSKRQNLFHSIPFFYTHLKEHPINYFSYMSCCTWLWHIFSCSTATSNLAVTRNEKICSPVFSSSIDI